VPPFARVGKGPHGLTALQRAVLGASERKEVVLASCFEGLPLRRTSVGPPNFRRIGLPHPYLCHYCAPATHQHPPALAPAPWSQRPGLSPHEVCSAPRASVRKAAHLLPAGFLQPVDFPFPPPLRRALRAPAAKKRRMLRSSMSVLQRARGSPARSAAAASSLLPRLASATASAEGVVPRASPLAGAARRAYSQGEFDRKVRSDAEFRKAPPRRPDAGAHDAGRAGTGGAQVGPSPVPPPRARAKSHCLLSPPPSPPLPQPPTPTPHTPPHPAGEARGPHPRGRHQARGLLLRRREGGERRGRFHDGHGRLPRCVCVCVCVGGGDVLLWRGMDKRAREGDGGEEGGPTPNHTPLLQLTPPPPPPPPPPPSPPPPK
jgi:hypothetical protein